MNYRKSVLQTNWYHGTIRDARIHNGGLRLTFTVDRGEYAYRNVVERFSLTQKGMERLENLFDGLEYIIVTDYTNDLFVEQFTNIKIRCRMKVDRHIKDDSIRNRVIELKPPNKPEDYNVLKPKDDEFYNKRNSGKGLPIRGSGE